MTIVCYAIQKLARKELKNFIRKNVVNDEMCLGVRQVQPDANTIQCMYTIQMYVTIQTLPIFVCSTQVFPQMSTMYTFMVLHIKYYVYIYGVTHKYYVYSYAMNTVSVKSGCVKY